MSQLRTSALDFAHRRLQALRSRQLYRQLSPVEAGAEPWVELDDRRLLNLSSNNSLGLATRPEVKAAAAAAAQSNGCGAAASRLISGTRASHQLLEDHLASFKGTESALLFNSGYTANLGLIPALVGPGDRALGDELNHASLIDGCRLSRAEYSAYAHCDAQALETQLAAAAGTRQRGRRLVVTESVFSMDGDLAPLAAIVDLCRRHDAMLLVDEAHATGCLGPGGRGLAAELGLQSHVTASMGTLSKALGGFGAFVAGEQLLTDYLVNVSRSFIFTTALPPPVVAAALAALDILEREPELVQQLRENGAYLRSGLQAHGFNTLDSATHIVPVLVGEAGTALDLAWALRREGVFAVAIRPPTVPPGRSRIRASVMATHTRDDLDLALAAFERAARRLGRVV